MLHTNSSDPAVLETVPPDLRDSESVLSLSESDQDFGNSMECKDRTVSMYV